MNTNLPNWDVYDPLGLQLQTGLDCGVHVCLYAMILCHGKGRIPEGSLDSARGFIKMKSQKKNNASEYLTS